jgi:hypothetical protein
VAGAHRENCAAGVAFPVAVGVVADVDRRLGQIDAAVEKATALGRTKSAMQLLDDQRKARAVLQEERKRESVALASLESQRAQVTAKAHRIEAEAAPIRFAAQAVGSSPTTRR